MGTGWREEETVEEKLGEGEGDIFYKPRVNLISTVLGNK